MPTRVLKNIRDLPLENTSEINMGGTQVTYVLDSRSYGSDRANLSDEMIFIKELKPTLTRSLTPSAQRYFYSAKYFIYSFVKSFVLL